MKKNSLKLLALTGFIIFSQNAAADYCKSTYGNKYFAGASISNGTVTCHYEYCYYTCMTDYYKIPGCFAPQRGNWEKKEGGFICTDTCSFVFDDNSCPKLMSNLP